MRKQQDYEQQFNDLCATLVGLVAGTGCTDQIYFKDDGLHGTYECKIEDYVPYTSLDQLELVIEVLKSTLGVVIDLEVQRRDGKLVYFRSMVDEMLAAVEDCGNYPYETLEDRAKETEDIKRKLVNAYCAKTMGYTRGVLGAEDVYFNEDGGVIDRIGEYNPYDDTNKLVAVIDAMAAGLNLRPKACTIAISGHQVAWRELILDNLVDGEDKEALRGVDKLVQQPNEACAEHMEMKEPEEMIESFTPEEDIMDIEEGWDEFDKDDGLHGTHGMYDNNIQEVLQENTKRQFEHSVQSNIVYDTIKEVIKDVGGRKRFWEWGEDYDNQVMNNFAQIGNPKSVYWQAARMLLLANHRKYDDMYVDNEGTYRIGEHANPFRCELIRFDELTNNGLIQAHKIEAYIRSPDNCMEVMWADTSSENPYILPDVDDGDLLTHLHRHRLKIITIILKKLAEEYKTEDDDFNKQCRRITLFASAAGYVIDTTTTFDPYHDMQQLAQIVEIIVVETGDSFVVSIEGSGGKINMMKEMRGYVKSMVRLFPNLRKDYEKAR